MALPTRGLVALMLLALAASRPAAADPDSVLLLGPGDLRIEQRTDGGYHLYVRAKPGRGSVLLTESTSDPAVRTDTYSYRALEWNPVNGDEPRMLDGKLIPRKSGIWSLVDSSPEPDPFLGRAFHIFIPWVLAWGYPWTRNGRVFIGDGSFIDIRVFAKPYADYSGAFADNPFKLRVLQRAAPPSAQQSPPPARPPETAARPAAAVPVARKPALPAKATVFGRYMPETIDAYFDLASGGKGKLRLAGDAGGLTQALRAFISMTAGDSADVVICLDTTESMQAPLDALRADLPALLTEFFDGSQARRIGLIAYRDYFEEYLTRQVDFVSSAAEFEAQLEQLRVAGGRDIPEAAYEGLYAALTEFPWSADKRMVILIGDAPPHPLPRGAVDRSSVLDAAASKGVEIDVVALPHPSQDQ